MAEEASTLDSNWLHANPLPEPPYNTDKNARGRVLVIGGSVSVSGGIMLTAEAALRAGAGKVQIASVSSITPGIGLAMPEVATIMLGETANGDVDVSHFERLEPSLKSCDAVVIGPAMAKPDAAERMTEEVIRFLSDSEHRPVIILDAAALLTLYRLRDRIKESPAHVVLTPHIGELAALLQCDGAEIERDPRGRVQMAAKLYGCTVLLKGATSYVAQADGTIYAFAGGGAGLATGGSGDVLAGLTGGLAARGASPHQALLWAVWLHGEAGRRCAEQIGPLGYLARELLAHIPALMRGTSRP